jgi:hypothetical protein
MSKMSELDLDRQQISRLKRTSHSYFAVFVDYGRKGIEAIVNPEDTRRNVVAKIKSGELKNIAFIHHVDGLFVEDLTGELIDEAEAELKAEGVKMMIPVDRQTANWDHQRDLIKHGAI